MARSRNVVGLAVVSLAFLCFTQQSLRAQNYRKVDTLAGTTLNEAVEVEGSVQRWVSGLGGNFYVLRTNWGEEILVRTSRELPAIDKRYKVRGLVTEQLGKRFISEEELQLITEETTRETGASGAAVVVQVPKVDLGSQVSYPPAQPQVSSAPPPGGREPESSQAQGGPKVLLRRDVVPWLLAGAGLVTILAAAVMFARRRPSSGTEISVGLASSPLAMAPVRSDSELAPSSKPSIPEPQGVTGSTVKLHRPPAGTLKVLPGRFEVVAGESEVKEIRFYKVPTQPVPEITFGRLAGAPYVHVQLNSPTVSGRQGKVTYQNGQWVLTNFAPATSNPTRVNGRDLAVDESVPLREGDRVEMGEVVLAFHER
ncbi:MAG: FHA domain-containing protein [Thermoanaerobaculum sp.]